MSLGIYAATCIRHYISHENTVLFWNRYSNIQNIYWSSFTLLYWYNLPYYRRFISNELKEIRVTCIHRFLIQWHTGKSFKKYTGKFCSVFNHVMSEYGKTPPLPRIHGGFMEWLLLLLGGFGSVKDLFLVSLFLLVSRFLFI